MMTFLHKSSDDQGKEQWSGSKTIDICNNLKYPQFCRSNISGLHTQTNVSGLPIMQVLNGYKTKEIQKCNLMGMNHLSSYMCQFSQGGGDKS